jgi:hypothetical protein
MALVLALMAPLNELAEATSRLTLFVFALVNTSLIRGQLPPALYQASSWAPWTGAGTSCCWLRMRRQSSGPDLHKAIGASPVTAGIAPSLCAVRILRPVPRATNAASQAQ